MNLEIKGNSPFPPRMSVIQYKVLDAKRGCRTIIQQGVGRVKSSTKLTGRVIYKGDPGYEAARKNWDPHTDKFPKVFVFAQRTKDVSNAIRWARENNVLIRPRSGRHALEVNLSQVNGGIVIDVSDLNSIKLDKKNGTVVVGTGNRVGRIANTLAKQGFIAPFGDSPTVGIGGITLGGELGLSSVPSVLSVITCLRWRWWTPKEK